MIISSWNVNSVRARIENIKEYLKKFSPDIVMMQEIKTQNETYPYDDFSSLKYENYVFGQKNNFNDNLFGFATSNTFTYCDIDDSLFINKVNKLNPKILRFPGGAVGNFYHFGKSGYGFDFDEYSCSCT